MITFSVILEDVLPFSRSSSLGGPGEAMVSNDGCPLSVLSWFYAGVFSSSSSRCFMQVFSVAEVLQTKFLQVMKPPTESVCVRPNMKQSECKWEFSVFVQLLYTSPGNTSQFCFHNFYWRTCVRSWDTWYTVNKSENVCVIRKVYLSLSLQTVTNPCSTW